MDKQAQHTPGPWSVTPSGNVGSKIAMTRVATVKGIVTRPEEADSNARLIAAAPRMLEFIKSILDPADLSTDPEKLIDFYERQARVILRDVEG